MSLLFLFFCFIGINFKDTALHGSKIKSDLMVVLMRKTSELLFVYLFFCVLPNIYKNILHNILPPATTKPTKNCVKYGNVFTSVCQEYCPQGGGGCVSQHAMGGGGGVHHQADTP